MKLSILASAALCISACPFMAAAASMDDVLARILQLEHTVQSSKEQLREARARIRALEAAVASSPTASLLRGSGEAVGTAGLCGCDTFNTSSVTITGDGATASLVVGEAATGTINGVNVAELSDTAVRTTGGQTIDGSLAVESLRIGDWSVSQDSEGNLEVTGPAGKLLTTSTAFDAPAVYANAVKPQSASTVELEGDLTVTGTTTTGELTSESVAATTLTVSDTADLKGTTTTGELTSESVHTASVTGLETLGISKLTVDDLVVTSSTNLQGRHGPGASQNSNCPGEMFVISFAPSQNLGCSTVLVVPAPSEDEQSVM